jgi:hypothetical protein
MNRPRPTLSVKTLPPEKHIELALLREVAKHKAARLENADGS